MLNRLIAIGLLSAVVGTAWISNALAQEGRAEVAVNSELREIGERYFGGHLQVYADGQLCGKLSFATPAPDGGAEFALGGEGQPAECSRAGATISFFDGNFVGLRNRYTLEPGERIEIDWFQVGAVREGTDDGPTPDGRTLLTVDPEMSQSGIERYGSLGVFADDERCGALEFTPGVTVFELGTEGQPAACGRDGAIISLVMTNGVRLSHVYRLTVGHAIPFQNFTIPPPGSGEPEPVDPAPGAPDTGTGSEASTQGRAGALSLAIIVGVPVLLLVVRGWRRVSPKPQPQ
jgi:hypothetical protein